MFRFTAWLALFRVRLKALLSLTYGQRPTTKRDTSNKPWRGEILRPQLLIMIVAWCCYFLLLYFALTGLFNLFSLTRFVGRCPTLMIVKLSAFSIIRSSTLKNFTFCFPHFFFSYKKKHNWYSAHNDKWKCFLSVPCLVLPYVCVKKS